MRYVHVTAARRNPDSNPKADRNKEIEAFYALDRKYRRPHYFASFVSEFKLGVNPQSTYSTPIGIYTYPVRYVVGYLQSHPLAGKTTLPFAGNKPYIQIGEITTDKVLFLDRYSEAQYKKDCAKLERYLASISSGSKQPLSESLAKQIASHLYKKYGVNVTLPKNITFSSIVDIAVELVKASFKKNGLRKIRGSHLIWCITQVLSYFSGVEKSKIKWNAIFRNVLGYQAIEDNGLGIIHFHEKTQTVFLTKQAIKLVKTIDNKVHEKRDLSPTKHNNDRQKILSINPSLKQLINDSTVKMEISPDGKRVVLSSDSTTIKNKTITNVIVSNIALSKCTLRNCTVNNPKKIISYSTLEDCAIQDAVIGDCQLSNCTIDTAIVHKANLVNCTVNGGAFRTVGSINTYSFAENCVIKSGLFRRVIFKNCQFPYDRHDERYSFENCKFEE